MNMHATIAAVRGPTANRLWDVAMLAYQLARSDFERFDTAVWHPLADEFDRISPRPDLWFEVVAQSGQTARYQVPANDLHAWDDHVSAVFRTKAAEVRKAWLDHRAAQERLGYDAASDEVERLCNVRSRARPASHARAGSLRAPVEAGAPVRVRGSQRGRVLRQLVPGLDQRCDARCRATAVRL